MMHCSGTMTSSQYLAWIRSALRSRWLRWPPRGEALKLARRAYNGSNRLQKWEYNCKMCDKWFLAKEVEVDHIEEAGSILTVEDIGPFAGRLYCETSNLRVLCKPCHKVYTLSQSKGITLEQARIEKAVNERMKDPKLLAWLEGYGYNKASVSNATKRKALVTAIYNQPKEK